MKRILILLSLLLVVSAIVGIYFATRKHYLQFKLLAEIPLSCEFNPLNYDFYHDAEDLKSFWNISDRTLEMLRKLPAGTTFDFKNHSYCFVFGRKVTAMWHSWKESRFDDPTPSYARNPAFIPVFVSFALDTTSHGPVYIYELPRDPRLRGFWGL
jgi:hypothetical protein